METTWIAVRRGCVALGQSSNAECVQMKTRLPVVTLTTLQSQWDGVVKPIVQWQQLQPRIHLRESLHVELFDDDTHSLAAYHVAAAIASGKRNGPVPVGNVLARNQRDYGVDRQACQVV